VPHKVWFGYRWVGNPIKIVIQTLAGFPGRQPGTARFRMYAPHKVWFGYRWVGTPINTWAGGVFLADNQELQG
jgi:hypothetical protein